MTKSWTKRFPWIVAAIALSVVAAACTSDSEGRASTSTTAADTTVVQDDAIEESPPETEQPTTTVAPERTGADLSSFEELPLPDYVVEVVGDNYASYLVEVEPGINVHVLEVGSGYPVYLQHGAPTSGLLYRKIAELLPPDQFRIIMPTMVGLGFSSKIPAEQHTLDNHARWMNATLNALELDELIYVGHDWGGPVGMGALERSPELMQGAVLLNTVFGAPTGPVEFSPALAGAIATPPEAELLVVGALFDQLPGAQSDPSSLSADVLDLYRRPVVESDNAIGPLAIIRMAADGPEHPTAEVLRAIDTYIAQLDVPAEIVWGVNDPFLGDQLESMMDFFPNATVTLTDSGHFLQEEVDAPEEIASAIQRVFEQIQGE